MGRGWGWSQSAQQKAVRAVSGGGRRLGHERPSGRSRAGGGASRDGRSKQSGRFLEGKGYVCTVRNHPGGFRWGVGEQESQSEQSETARTVSDGTGRSKTIRTVSNYKRVRSCMFRICPLRNVSDGQRRVTRHLGNETPSGQSRRVWGVAVWTVRYRPNGLVWVRFPAWTVRRLSGQELPL